MPDLVGVTLGRYRIIRQIGQGGMATVYEAFQPALDRYVAIKVLPAYFAHEQDFSERFWREVTAIAKLEHPNILPVYDSGEEDDTPYLVMKYVPGGTLKDLMGKPLPVAYVVKIITQIASALNYAHDRGIIHRDIKPANVLLADSDWALLSDFGIAKIVSGSGNLTKTGVGIGTPEYMAPEQGMGKADHRSDIYSLGVVLYEMLTGKPPFIADTPIAVILKHIGEALPLPTTVNPNLPAPIERVILKALAKDPDDRYQSANEMAAALNEAAQPYLGQTVPIIDQTGAPVPAETAVDALVHKPASEPAAPPKSFPLGIVLIGGVAGLLILLLASGGFFVFLNIRNGSSTSTPSASRTSAAVLLVGTATRTPQPATASATVTISPSPTGAPASATATPAVAETPQAGGTTATPEPPTATPPAATATMQASPTRPPTATALPPSPTSPPPTSTPVPPSPTPLPPTPVPVVNYQAPVLTGPAQNATFDSAGASIVLSWNLPQGLQADNDWFHLTISVSDNHQWDVSHFTKSTSYQVGSYLCGVSNQYVWSVTTWHQTGSDPKDGAPAGPQSESRTFNWGGCGTGSGGTTGAPTPSGGLH